MFHDVRLSLDISQGATATMEFSTTILTSKSGREQRVGQWSQPRLKWQIRLDQWSRALIDEFLAFVRARRGPLYGFRMRDWADWYAGLTPSAGSLVLGTPESIGTGDGSQTAFNLTKKYSSGGVDVLRRIYKPVAGTVRVFVAGVERYTGWTVDDALGVVTFTSGTPTAGQAVAWAGQFDVPVRFTGDRFDLTLKAFASGTVTLDVIELHGSEVEGA